jgi:hypothetical protein
MKIDLIKRDDSVFLKRYQILPEEDRFNLLLDCEKYLVTHRKNNEIFPPIMAEKFFTKQLLKLPSWNKLTKEVLNSVNFYSKKTNNYKLKFESCWINKVGEYGKKDATNNIYFDKDLDCYCDNHYHAHHKNQLIICIFFLQNASKKYGTIIKLENENLILNGEENSFSIFDPRLYHAALFDDAKITSVYPRYIIAMSFIKGI